MTTLSDDMKRIVGEQRLGFWASVGEDGSPNLSPKGTTGVWDDDHLFFADVRSPQTVANVRRGSAVEVNVVDPFARRGYRFSGPAEVIDEEDERHATGVELLRGLGSTLAHRARTFVLLEVREARPLTSPAYDDGADEAELVRRYRAHFDRLHPA